MVDNLISEIQQQLELKKDVVRSLEGLDTLLSTSSQVPDILSSVSLPLLFSCLETEDLKQVNLTCSVLNKLLCYLPALELVKYGNYVELGLQYPEVRVAKTCLQALFRLSEEEMISEMILSDTMLHLITQTLGSQDLESASLSEKLLLNFSSKPQILESRLKATWLGELRDLLVLNETVCFRVYDLLVKTCLQGGPQCLKIVGSSDLLDKLVDKLETEDPLVKMNCIELLTSLTWCEEGVAFLQSRNVLEKLYHTLQCSQEDSLGKLIIPAVVKFFAEVCMSAGSQLATQYPGFLIFILEAVLSPQDETLWGVSVDTVGLLASSVDGRSLLFSQELATKNALKKLGELIANSPSEVRCRSLRAVRMMVMCEEDCNWEESTSKQLFVDVHPTLFKLLFSIVRQPFQDLRLSGLMVMVEMSGWEWGQREMQNYPGFLEYILDRHSAPDKEGKELQYEVVHRIVKSKCGQKVWGDVNLLKMQKYDREGPFYYTADVTVPVEGSL